MDAFPLVLPTTAAQRKEVLTQLEKWRNTTPKVDVFIQELKGAQLLLTEAYAGYSLMGEPPPASEATRPEPEGFADPSCDSVYLVRPLQAGLGWTSQVWLASFRPDTTADEANLVVKIYQSSLHAAMHAGTIRKFVHRDDTWQMFHEFQREAEAYQTYAALQGSYVPHVRGFYLVTLPNGERSVAMVMERIRKVEPSPSTIELRHAFDGLLAAACALYEFGQFSSDFRPRNVLWPATADGRCAPQPVFIDFGRMNSKLERFEVNIILVDCIRTMRQYTFPLDGVMMWAEAAITLTSPIAERFSLSAADVSMVLDLGGSDAYEPERDRSRSPRYDLGEGESSTPNQDTHEQTALAG